MPDDNPDDFDYAAMAIGHLRDSGTWESWEDWFTEKGLGILGRPILVRRIFDRLHDRFFLSEVDQIWSYINRQKVKDPKGYFMKILGDATPEDLEGMLRKIQRHEELKKLSGHNMDPASAERQLKLRNEFICDHIFERRTIEWMMAKERLNRSELLEVWDRNRPGMDCPGIRREGAESWEDVKDAPANWRQHDETEKLRERGRRIAAEAEERKMVRRKAKGLSTRDPEELTVDDILDPLGGR